MNKSTKWLSTIALISILSIGTAVNIHEANMRFELNNKIAILEVENAVYKNEITALELNLRNSAPVVSSRGEQGTKFTVSAYDLSVQSCGKYPSHPKYGITATGYNLKNLDYKTAKVVAVDPKVIPIGSLVRITFQDKAHMKYNGIYHALDTGSGIKGRHIDLFIEDSGKETSEEAINFGRVQALVQIIK